MASIILPSMRQARSSQSHRPLEPQVLVEGRERGAELDAHQSRTQGAGRHCCVGFPCTRGVLWAPDSVLPPTRTPSKHTATSHERVCGMSWGGSATQSGVREGPPGNTMVHGLISAPQSSCNPLASSPLPTSN